MRVKRLRRGPVYRAARNDEKAQGDGAVEQTAATTGLDPEVIKGLG
jgi:hypothetical protein